MKKRQRIKTKVGLGLVLVASLALAMAPTGAKAQDSDLDGFTDLEELAGIELPSGLILPTGDILPNGNYYLPPCVGNEDPVERALCVDLSTRDLFVILRPASPTNIPLNPLEFLSKPQANDGLGIAVHELFVDPNVWPTPGRNITFTQKAVRVTENLDPTGNILGVANYGTPNGLDEATVFTERIINHVYSVYAEVEADGYEIPPENVINETVIIPYTKQIIAHEVGHMMVLAVDYNSRFGGYHYKSGSGVIMEQSVVYTSKRGVVTFYISEGYAAPDQDAATLH